MSPGGEVDDSIFDTILTDKPGASIRRGNVRAPNPCRRQDNAPWRGNADTREPRPHIVGRLRRLLGPIRGERLLDRNPSGFDCNE